MSSLSVIVFWTIAVLLIAVALVFLLPPLLGRARQKSGPESMDVNAAVYRSRLEELQREVEDGTLDSEDFDQAKSELEREILESVVPTASGEAGSSASTTAALCLAALLPALAFGLYLVLGTPQAIGWKRFDDPGASMGMATGEPDREALERMAASFAERLSENPGEGEGWLVLGRTYVMLERYDRAVEAFAKANALLGDTPDVLVDYAEAEAMVNNNRFSVEARQRIEEALELAPRHEKALWLGAFAAAQHGDIDAAVANWKILLENEADPGRRQLIQGLIARVKGEPPPTATGPAASDSPGVKVRVTLDESLATTLKGSETVFVFARDAAGTGPPLAVYRTRVDELPATIVLNDSMSMVPSLRISASDQVTVTARVSLSGDARPRSGDLQGSSSAVEVGEESAVDITINERVP
ncbi:MAG TPA: c-type cytochrome biogenesis protein CcmI [Gammaproteobacteria bacterium]|nr:c-type cytochrome biogenesis protein CcmI [Gammaproteobacteria bacterium]